MNKPSERGNIAIILLFLVALIIVGAGAYFYGKGSLKLLTKSSTPSGTQVSATITPIPDETANWKTYTSSCGFTIRYPETWTASKNTSDDSSCAYIKAPDFSATGETPSGFYVYVSKISLGTLDASKKVTVNSLEDYVKYVEGDVLVGGGGSELHTPISDRQNKTIGVYSGVQFNYSAQDSFSKFAFINGGLIYGVSWPWLSYYSGNYKIDPELVIKSIKF
ncbi:MAG: hypothetical protein HY376_01575 [Candidatus Blackburnbacteria bacterium]|nr:hypothetical protein [Candidatus Blackburnbacteria bacterium]